MPIEKSAGAIIFRKEKGKIYYLVLHYPPDKRISSSRGHWDYVKGHIEKDEVIEDTIRREAKEETGIEDLKFVEGFKEWFKYFFRLEDKNIFKTVTFLLAEVRAKKIKLSHEHLDYKWLPYKKALGQLTFENAKKVLEKAHKYLVKHKT